MMRTIVIPLAAQRDENAIKMLSASIAEASLRHGHRDVGGKREE
jgi:hypothetical protein